MKLRAVVGCALVALALTACPKKPAESIVSVGEGRQLTDEEIDREPIALLPGGTVGIVSADMQKVFASQFGKKVVGIAESRAPVPASANFVPSRDLIHAYVGIYSMQGADVAAVLTGTFDKAAIERAADGTTNTPLGTPVVKSTYANRTLYTSRNLGFVVLTSRTVLMGNETGIRRSLDRIKEGRVRDQTPSWFRDLMKTPNAPIVAGFDLRTAPLTEAARGQMPFLNGVETAGMLANLEPPGINVAGTLSYEDAESAAKGAASLMQVKELIASWGWLASLMGIAQPIRQLDAKAEGKKAKFVAGLDAQAIGQLLDQLSTYLGAAMTAPVK
jgi:hypothetical protein